MRTLKNESGDGNIIAGVIGLGVVGIVIIVMVMIFSNIEPSVLDSAATVATDETWNCSTIGSFVAPTYSFARTPGVEITNSTVTFTETTDYIVYSNNTIQSVIGGTMIADTEYNLDYNYQGAGYNSVEVTSGNVYTGFDLQSIAPIVLAASLILGIILTLAGGVIMSRRR